MHYFTPSNEKEFIKNLTDILNSNINFIQIRTTEEDRVLKILKNKMPDIIKPNEKKLGLKNIDQYDIQIWDEHLGLRRLRDVDIYEFKDINGNKVVNGDSDLMFIKLKKNNRTFQQLISTIEVQVFKTVIVINDFEHLIKHPISTRALLNLNDLLIANEVIIIFISEHTSNIPEKLKKHMMIIDLPLPDEDIIKEKLHDLKSDYLTAFSNELSNDEIEQLEKDIPTEILKACQGLTLAEIDNIASLSLITKKYYDIEIFNEMKKQIILKSGLLEIHDPVDISQVGGLKYLKEYIIQRKNIFFEKPSLLNGILLLGPPGVGKSLSAKAVASIFNVPLIRLDMSSLKNSLVGKSEANLRNALKQIDASSPCVVWIDEIEKVLTGVQSSGRSDSGTTSSMFGQLLFWMQEKKTSTYIVATCNDYMDLLQISQGAIMRRFDDIFYLQIPDTEERREILNIMLKKYNVDLTDNEKDFIIKETAHYTGAEIEKVVKNLLFEDLNSSIKNVKCIYHQNHESLEILRKWAILNARLSSYEESIADIENTCQVVNDALSRFRMGASCQ